MIASVVIRAKNEARFIGETLEAVFSQKGVPIFEVIVVDSGSTDQTLDIARRFPLTLVEMPPHQFTYGRSLNLGIAHAQGEFVVSLSAHSLPADEWWLRNLLRPFADPLVAGVYGRHIPRDNATVPELFGMWFAGTMSRKPRRQTRDMMFSNANGAFRRSLARRIPFDERLGGAEDLAWAHCVQKLGFVICYEPTAAVYHSHGESIPRLLRRMWHDQPTIWRLKLGLLKPSFRRSADGEPEVPPLAAPRKGS